MHLKTLMNTCGGLRPPPPQVTKPSYRGPAAPGPPAKYTSHPQDPHTHFHRHGNGGSLQLGLAQLGFAQVGIAQIFGTPSNPYLTFVTVLTTLIAFFTEIS